MSPAEKEMYDREADTGRNTDLLAKGKVLRKLSVSTSLDKGSSKIPESPAKKEATKITENKEISKDIESPSRSKDSSKITDTPSKTRRSLKLFKSLKR